MRNILSLDLITLDTKDSWSESIPAAWKIQITVDLNYLKKDYSKYNTYQLNYNFSNVDLALLTAKKIWTLDNVNIDQYWSIEKELKTRDLVKGRKNPYTVTNIYPKYENEENIKKLILFS